MLKIKTSFFKILMIAILLYAIAPIAFAAIDVPAISAVKIYDANEITIATTKFEYNKSWGGYYAVNAVIKNSSAKDLYYEVKYVKINGFQIPVMTFGDVYAGMEADMVISLDPDYLKIAGVEHILDIEFCIELQESETHRVIDRPAFLLKTSDSGKFEQSYGFNGEEVYNANGVRVLARLGDSSEKYPVLLYLENNSGKTISIMYEDIAINNKMVMEMMTCGQVISSAIQVIEMNRAVLTTWDETVPENKDITSVDFKLSFLPIESDGSFSTANEYHSERITVKR